MKSLIRGTAARSISILSEVCVSQQTYLDHDLRAAAVQPDLGDFGRLPGSGIQHIEAALGNGNFSEADEGHIADRILGLLCTSKENDGFNYCAVQK